MALTRIKSGIANSTFVTDRLGYTPLNKVGDTPTGVMDLSNGVRIGGLYHYRKSLYNGSNVNAAVFNILAFARYYGGENHIELVIRKTYFDAADYAHYVIQGHTRNNYTPGLTMTGIRTTTNINAPVNSTIVYTVGDYGWCDIRVTVPAYNNYEVIIIADRTPSSGSVINTAATNTWVAY